jgi:hypothetical protein
VHLVHQADDVEVEEPVEAVERDPGPETPAAVGRIRHVGQGDERAGTGG